MKSFASVLVVAFLAAVALFLVSACETGKGTRALTVEPLEANLLGETNNLVTFTVVEGLRELSLPLRWDVANTDLGHIIHQAGNRATYERRTPHGINSVYVEDQYGASGLASVRQ
ncbi:MAG: hypothetical protein FJ225_13505 [Lentisphaerae bacterium]|nr:hypothetical protein [Lentisphaerota bacterium]